MRYFVFELKKWKANRKNYIILGIYLAALIGGVFLSERKAEENKKEYHQTMTDAYMQLYSEKNLYEIEVEESDEDENDDLNYLIKKYNEAMERLDSRAIAINRDQWKDSLVEENKYIEVTKEIHELGGQLPENLYEDEEEMELTVLKNEYLLEKRIAPTDKTFGTKGFYYLKTWFDIFFQYVGILLLLFLFFDIYTTERERNTYKLLKVLPIKKRTTINTKFVLSAVNSITALVISSLVAFLAGLVNQKATGSLQYPTLVAFEEDGEFVVKTLGRFLVEGVFFFVVVALVLLIFLRVLSKISKDSYLVLILASPICFIPIVIWNSFWPIVK